MIDAQKMEFPSVSSKKLLGTGFEFKYGLEEMFDDAIECCKQKKNITTSFGYDILIILQ